jgi:hypothetical protein
MIKVFYSYAREDRPDIDLLIRRYTDPLARSGRIEHWLDRYLSRRRWATRRSS